MKFIAKTLYGLEDVLAAELACHGAGSIKTANRAVTFEGDLRLLYRVNYCVRTAISVLWQVAEFNISTPDDLYRHGARIKWEDYFRAGHTFSVVPVVKSHFFRHTGYAGLILKDSVADRFRNIFGKRPSVDSANPGIVINLHIDNDRVNISLDSSVVPLFRRGYRKEQTAAPLNEVLAAGILDLSGWDGVSSITDPMCGSGTFLIEAAIRANKIPAGKFRQGFGFQQWRNYDGDKFEDIRNECNNLISFRKIKISGSDISRDALNKAIANIRAAGMTEVISVEKCDFRDLRAQDDEGYIIINPPYGQRIREADIADLYKMIGSVLKHNFAGHTASLITSDMEALKHVGLKPSFRKILYNGALKCVLATYRLYSGRLSEAKRGG